MTRKVEDEQMELGSNTISKIQFDIKSRDDIPKILKGLQHLYLTESIRKAVFELLEEKMLPGVNKGTGRPGMSLWKILVLGVLRLDLNCDYDRLHELVNQHKTVRQMLGHSNLLDETSYELQTIKDNVVLLTPELLEELNQVIVQAGHGLVGKKKGEEELRGRSDSFVVETDVHYPTDTNLLYDAIRKVINLSAELSARHEQSGWRQSGYNVKQVKRQVRIVQKKKRATGKTEKQKGQQEESLKKAHKELIELSEQFLFKSSETVLEIKSQGELSLQDTTLIAMIKEFEQHAKRQIEQIRRRVLQGETIPHEEKVFSIFEPHTEWVSKGKAGVPVELGLRVCVIEDQHQFILHHEVMEKQTDDQVAVPMIKKTKAAFPDLASCSFDKGFHSPQNQKELGEMLEVVAMKRKGKLSQKSKEIESSEEFKNANHKHSAVESAIHALEVHGLDKCRDHGLDGFKRYVALAVVARNIHRIGTLLYQQEQKKLNRQKTYSRDECLPLAA